MVKKLTQEVLPHMNKTKEKQNKIKTLGTNNQKTRCYNKGKKKVYATPKSTMKIKFILKRRINIKYSLRCTTSDSTARSSMYLTTSKASSM